MISKGWIISLVVASAALAAVLGLANLTMGELNQDEGWYLYAAGQVAQGHYPYKDFAFTQAPALPFVYALAQPLVDRYGIAGGRLFTMKMGFIGALLAAWLAARLAPKGWGTAAGLLAFMLIAVNVYQSYFTTVVKTYALCGLFLAAGFLALSYMKEKGRLWPAFVAGLLLACAAGTRISAGAALAVGGFYLLLNRKQLGDAAWLAFGVGGVAGLCVIFLPWYIVARDGFLFGVVQYHSARSAGGLVSALVYKCGFISRLVQAYYLPVALGLLVMFARWIKPVATGPGPRLSVAIWTAVALVSIVHFTAPFPYDDYEVPLYPLFCAALAVAGVRWLDGLSDAGLPKPRLATGVLVTVLLLCTASSFSSQINQNWMTLGRDRIWWKLRKQPVMKELKFAADVIRSSSKPGDLLLTQDTYLAVESGRSVPRGLEMGPFSYFQDLPRDRAERIHVVNREMMTELLRTTPATVAAFSGYSLSIRSPEVEELSADEQETLWAAVRERYGDIAEFSSFGQGATTLKIMFLMKGAPP
ncbi:MAG: hypothetical protein V1929_02485 [bacterium]